MSALVKTGNTEFKHVIITHFNIRWRVSCKKGRYNFLEAPPSQEWMEHRFQLFDQYCYPSIIGQTNQNFTWVVCFDPNNIDIKRIKKYDRIVPIFIPFNRAFSPSNIISTIIPWNFSYLITTNLDNDDALGVRYVENIQTAFNPDGNFQLIELCRGYLYDHYEKYIRWHDEKSGAFMSFVERISEYTRRSRKIKTIRHLDHRRLLKKYKNNYTRVETNDPMWLQVVHDKNAKNLMDRGHRVDNTDLSTFFPLFNVHVK